MSTTSSVAERQRPLRARYRTQPGEAVSVKRARSISPETGDPLHVTVEAFGAAIPTTRWEVGVDEKVGGLDDFPNPGHVLCAALAACAETTLRMLADRLGVGIERMCVEVTGEVDCRGCLALDASVPVGFRSIDLKVRLSPAAGTDPRTLELLRESGERLCVVLETLRRGVPVSVSYL